MMTFARAHQPAFSRTPRRVLWLWALPLLFLGFFFFVPLGSVFRLAGVEIVQSGLDPSAWRQVGRSLGFTLWQAGLSTLATLLLGIPAAAVFGRYNFPGKKLLRVITTLPFILPTVVVAAAFNTLIGPNGWINLGLMGLFNLDSAPLHLLNSLPAIVLAHIFYNTTIIIRVVGNAWSRLDVRLEQAARILGASPARTLKEVTLPLLRPSILAATLMVFIFDFTSFGVVLLLGGPQFATLEVEIYTQALYMLNLPLAAFLSAIQLACTLLLTVAYSRITANLNLPLAPRIQNPNAARPRSRREKWFVGSVLTVVILLLVLPLTALGVRSVTRLEADRGQRTEIRSGLTLDFYKELFINRRGSFFYVPPIEAAKNSIIYASLTVVISVSLGFLAASALAQRARINRLLDPLLMLPLGASAVTLGLGFILVFNRPPLDPRSFPLLLPIAHSLVALPFVVRTIQPALLSIPQNLRQAAAVLGAAPLRVWWEVDVPIIARAVLVAAVFSFTISLGEFGATSFLARPENPTIPVAIYRFISQPGGLNYGQALAMSTLLMGVCALGILVIERLRLPGAAEEW